MFGGRAKDGTQYTNVAEIWKGGLN
jgi:hypothetical protein